MSPILYSNQSNAMDIAIPSANLSNCIATTPNTDINTAYRITYNIPNI